MRSRYFPRLALVSMSMVLLLMAASATRACADAGVPMLLVIWPRTWWLLPAIVLVEGYIARIACRLGIWQALRLSAFANGASTLIGIPLTWLILLVLEIGTVGGRAYGLSSVSTKLLSVTLQSPWLVPYDGELRWMVPAAAAFLCVPFFFMSVWAEIAIGRLLVEEKVRSRIRRWAWMANACTYSISILVLVAMAIHAAVRRY